MEEISPTSEFVDKQGVETLKAATTLKLRRRDVAVDPRVRSFHYMNRETKAKMFDGALLLESFVSRSSRSCNCVKSNFIQFPCLSEFQSVDCKLIMSECSSSVILLHVEIFAMILRSIWTA